MIFWKYLIQKNKIYVVWNVRYKGSQIINLGTRPGQVGKLEGIDVSTDRLVRDQLNQLVQNRLGPESKILGIFD